MLAWRGGKRESPQAARVLACGWQGCGARLWGIRCMHFVQAMGLVCRACLQQGLWCNRKERYKQYRKGQCSMATATLAAGWRQVA